MSFILNLVQVNPWRVKGPLRQGLPVDGCCRSTDIMINVTTITVSQLSKGGFHVWGL